MKRKDPNAPKRPMSAFMMFSRDKRDEIKRQNPNASFGEIGKMVADRWMAMTEDEKVPYGKKSEEDMVRYLKDKQEYEARQDDEEESCKSDDSSSEEESKPKVRRVVISPLSSSSFPPFLSLSVYIEFI